MAGARPKSGRSYVGPHYVGVMILKAPPERPNRPYRAAVAQRPGTRFPSLQEAKLLAELEGGDQR